MPFNNRLDCPKCGYTRFDWKFFPTRRDPNGDHYEALEVRCQSCGWTVEMEPKDA